MREVFCFVFWFYFFGILLIILFSCWFWFWLWEILDLVFVCGGGIVDDVGVSFVVNISINGKYVYDSFLRFYDGGLIYKIVKFWWDIWV